MILRYIIINSNNIWQYLKEHEPELYARRGMMRSAGGRAVLRRSMEKYAEAVRLYETTDEDLQTIAQRLGLVYNSLGGFMRRHFPELLARHKGKAAGPKGTARAGHATNDAGDGRKG